MKNYTEQAKAHIESLIAGGLTKADIMLRYTANRVTIAHPVIEDGKAKLVKVVFKAPKAPKAEQPAAAPVVAQAPVAQAAPVVAQAEAPVVAQAPAGIQG